jgi:hypothetical protein
MGNNLWRRNDSLLARLDFEGKGFILAKVAKAKATKQVSEPTEHSTCLTGKIITTNTPYRLNL